MSRLPGILLWRELPDSAHRAGGQPAGGGKFHSGAHAVVPYARAQPVRQTLGKPPLDAAGGDTDDLGSEGILERSAEQLTQTRSEPVGALGAVDVQSS